jgi:hypothetical protein
MSFLSDVAASLVPDLESTFAGQAEAMLAEKQFVLAAQTIERGLEACDKYAFHFDQLEKCSGDLTVLRKIPDVRWAEVEWKGFRERTEIVYTRLIVSLGQTLPELAAIPASSDLPDYFGHAYVVLAEECYRMMSVGNTMLFDKVFPKFFDALLPAFERTLAQQVASKEDDLLALSSEPILDILELSGYAIIYSELDGREFWNVAKRLWDQFFTRIPNPRNFMQGMIGLVDYRRSMLAIFPHDVIRTRWMQDLEKGMRSRGLLDEYGNIAIQHTSEIIRAMSRWHVARNAMDVFLVTYLMKRPEFTGLTLPRRSEFFADSLRRERSPTRSGWKKERRK